MASSFFLRGALGALILGNSIVFASILPRDLPDCSLDVSGDLSVDPVCKCKGYPIGLPLLPTVPGECSYTTLPSLDDPEDAPVSATNVFTVSDFIVTKTDTKTGTNPGGDVFTEFLQTTTDINGSVVVVTMTLGAAAKGEPDPAPAQPTCTDAATDCQCSAGQSQICFQGQCLCGDSVPPPTTTLPPVTPPPTPAPTTAAPLPPGACGDPSIQFSPTGCENFPCGEGEQAACLGGFCECLCGGAGPFGCVGKRGAPETTLTTMYI